MPARITNTPVTVTEIDHSEVMPESLLRKVDAVTFHVPDLDAGISFYVDRLGHRLRWRNDDTEQAALALPESDTELVLTTRHGYEPNWLVGSVDDAAETIATAGGRVLSPPFDIPVGRIAVVADPFDNVLVLVDLSKGRYVTDDQGRVTAVLEDAEPTASATSSTAPTTSPTSSIASAPEAR